MPSRKKSITVLIVPDDKTEPASYHISHRLRRALAVLGVVLALHGVAGAIAYWQFVAAHGERVRLRKENRWLKEENKQIALLSAELMELEQSQQRVRRVLGLGTEVPTVAAKESAPTASGNAGPPVMSSMLSEEPPGDGVKKLNFLSSRGTNPVDFARSVPTLLPVDGFLTADFVRGEWPLSRDHLGIDIAAKQGSVVRASADGLIVFANWTDELGNLVIIYHGAGFFTYYGHNQRVLRSEKTWVRKGDPIALLGSSGHSSGPHLHFEIWKEGVPQDPKDYLLPFQEMKE